MNDARTIAIAPVRKLIRVSTRRARAFEVSTVGLDRGWPGILELFNTESQK
jgi:hypothetical protein